jgi:hypothetical protein
MVVPPLLALYPRAKRNDWRAVTNFVKANITSNDRVLVESAPWAERAFRWYSPEARARFASVADLRVAKSDGRRVWYVSFGGFFDRASDAWAKSNLERISDGEWQQPGLVYEPQDGFSFPQSESGATLYVSEW